MSGVYQGRGKARYWQSALSRTIRGLEARLGLQQLTRTTHSVALTEEGERLLRRLWPRFDFAISLAQMNSVRYDGPDSIAALTIPAWPGSGDYRRSGR